VTTASVVAAVTVGQAPREDILDEMRALAPHVRWIQQGALDGIDESGLASLAPSGGEFPLVTRMRAGRPVIVGEQAVRPLVQQAVDCIATDADLVVILCSTPLALESPVPVLFPDRLLTAAVGALRLDAPIAVLTPREEQIPLQEARWRGLGFRAIVLCASPYGGTDFRRLGRVVRQIGAAAVVLDCLAYSAEMKATLAAASGLPTLLVRSLVANVAAEMAWGPGTASRARVYLNGQRAAHAAGLHPAARATERLPRAPANTGPKSETGAARLASELMLDYFLGTLSPGDRVPSVRVLASQLGVSPTTVADWYRELQDEGVVASRRRSGTFLKSPGIGPPPTAREAGLYSVLQRALGEFRLLGMSVRDVAELLGTCTSSLPAGSFKFGWVLPREFYEILTSSLHRRFGFTLPATLLTSDRGGYDELQRQLAGDRSVRCLLSTYLNSGLAYELAREFKLDLIVLQLDPRGVEVLRVPIHSTRYLITRDATFADAIRHLADAVQPRREAARIVVTDLGDARGLAEADRSAAEIYVSPVALDRARLRFQRSTDLKVWQARLAEQTIQEILCRYLLAERHAIGWRNPLAVGTG
jgi:protein AroM